MGGGNTCEVSSGVIKEKYFWNLEFLILDLPPLRIRSQQRSDGTCFFFTYCADVKHVEDNEEGDLDQVG